MPDSTEEASARWLRAVNLFIENGATDAGAAMVKAGFSKSSAVKQCQRLKKHPIYLEWVKAQTKKGLITKAYLEEKLYNIIEENGKDRVAAIGKAMEMFGFEAPKKGELTGTLKVIVGKDNLQKGKDGT